MGQRLIISEEERSQINKMYGLVNEQDEPGYRINKELKITSAFDWDKGESRTIYVKTLPGVFRENGKIREGVIFAYFSYDKDDKKGYGEERLEFGKQVQFTCGKNYVNLPPIPGLNNQGSEKFAGKLSDEDNQWVQQYCKREENTTPNVNVSPEIKVYTSLNEVGRNEHRYVVDGTNLLDEDRWKMEGNNQTVVVDVTETSSPIPGKYLPVTSNFQIKFILPCNGGKKQFSILNRPEKFDLILSDKDVRDINILTTGYFCKKK